MVDLYIRAAGVFGAKHLLLLFLHPVFTFGSGFKTDLKKLSLGNLAIWEDS